MVSTSPLARNVFAAANGVARPEEATLGARPRGLAIPVVAGLELGMAPYRGGEAPWGAVGALWHMLRVTRVPVCRVRLLVGARPKGLALPSWAGLELGMGSYRVGESAVGRGGSTVAHATRVARMNECRMRLLVALARARQGARGGPQALWGLLSDSPWLSHRAQPWWAMSQTGRLRQGQTQRQWWLRDGGGCGQPGRQCAGLGWAMMRGRRRERDSGKKALAFSLHPFEPMDVV